MKKTEQKYQTYVQILKEELIPAMGCTEPISLAYGASLARKVLNHLPTKIVVEASGSIIKNVKSVIVPHTHHLKGIKAAVCAGIIGGNADKYLEVLSQIDEKTKEKIDQYIEKVDFEEHFLESSKVFDYIITVWNKKEYVKVRVSDSHMNIVCIEKKSCNSAIIISKGAGPTIFILCCYKFNILAFQFLTFFLIGNHPDNLIVLIYFILNQIFIKGPGIVCHVLHSTVFQHNAVLTELPVIPEPFSHHGKLRF
jgi:hypothetical protein